MSRVTYQTVSLSRGKHRSPDEGACVMELASMLAGESFTDRPFSVCPVIGSFLRAYNDAVDDRRRQDLYACAAKVVGSRASADVERQRQAWLMEWTSDLRGRKIRNRFRLPSLFSMPCGPNEGAGIAAVRSIGRHTAKTHAAVLGLIDELVQIGASGRHSTLTTHAGCAPSLRTPEHTIVAERGR